MQRHVERILLVSEAEIRATVRFLLERVKDSGRAQWSGRPRGSALWNVTAGNQARRRGALGRQRRYRFPEDPVNSTPADFKIGQILRPPGCCLVFTQAGKTDYRKEQFVDHLPLGISIHQIEPLKWR